MSLCPNPTLQVQFLAIFSPQKPLHLADGSVWEGPKQGPSGLCSRSQGMVPSVR